MLFTHVTMTIISDLTMNVFEGWCFGWWVLYSAPLECKYCKLFLLFFIIIQWCCHTCTCFSKRLMVISDLIREMYNIIGGCSVFMWRVETGYGWLTLICSNWIDQDTVRDNRFSSRAASYYFCDKMVDNEIRNHTR